MIAIFVVIIAAALGLGLIGKNVFKWFTTPTNASSQYDLPPAKKALNLNRQFTFPLLDSKGQEISKIKFSLETAELRDEIIVQGKRATAVKGRTFLILNFKINNDYNKSVQINTRDYVRLSVNGNDKELLAADIHNDPVEVQAISVKYTRLGFPINDSDKNLKLKVGEINGAKQDIDLKF